MKKIRYACYAMVLSLVFGTIIASGSLIALAGKLNTDVLTQSPFSIPTLLVTCLDPLTIALEILAIVWIVRGRKQFNATQQRLSVFAAGIYLLWAGANLFGFLPLSFIGSRNGSLSSALTGQWIKASAALLAYSVPALLVYGISQLAQRWLLGIGFMLSTIGGFGSVALTIGQFSLVPRQLDNQVMYIASFNVDYTRFPFPLLLAISYLGGLLYLIAYTWLAIRVRNTSEPGQEVNAAAA